MTTEQSDAVDAIRAQQVDAFPGRCTFTWTPTPGSDFPEVRCTNRSAAIHRHAWNAVEEDQWKARTITTPSTDHLPNAINRLQAYIDARTGSGHAARALRDENTHTILLDDLGAVLQAASRAIAAPPLSPTSAFIAALEQDRVDWYADHRSEPGIAENAFERGWDARRAYDRAATQRIRDALDNLHANDGMPHSQRAALYDLVSALDA